MLVNAVDAAEDVAVDNNVLDVVADNVSDVVVDSVLDAVADSVLDVVLTALIALAASIAGAVVLEEVSSPLVQKGDDLRRMDCPCIIYCRGSSL
jgi:ABC-type phosphate transport system permease subunit